MDHDVVTTPTCLRLRRLGVSSGLAAFVLLGGLLEAAAAARASEVAGRVAMPEVCSPAVSPAVVTLEPVDPSASPAPGALGSGGGRSAEVVLVDQQGLQFVPRVQAMTVGQRLRFTNADSERHTVHVVTPGFDFNESMAPGEPREWVPEKPGVVRLACDIHSHMRGYVVVSASPWVRVCTREGAFRLRDVPEGRYVLNVWHEMGDPLRREVEVRGDAPVDLGTLTLTAPALSPSAMQSAPVRPWPEVIDRIGLKLAEALDLAQRREFKSARTLVEDAYFAEFEASDMETAIRSLLGYARKGEIEGKFMAIMADIRKLADREQSLTHMADLNRQLLLDLVAASAELGRKGVTDRARLYEDRGTVGLVPTMLRIPDPAAGQVDPRALLAALERGLAGVQDVADRGDARDAASAMIPVYFTNFEPIERVLNARRPQETARLEAQFNTLRGEIGAGASGPALAAKLAGLRGEVEAALGRVEADSKGRFGPAFAQSLFIILREGVEVILLLTMLVALVAKTGQPGAMRAIAWGVGLAVVASVLTAIGLNLVISSVRNQAHEVAEGLVMLAASGVLFYVSYWLISQSESKRWMDFLKRNAARGAEFGGLGTLALTAFLAVYREGAETALLYQAMIGGLGNSREGLMGLAAGVGVGLVLLAIVAVVVGAGSVRLPIRSFFKLTGVLLFAMAVVFAGNGVHALQVSTILKTTPLGWLGAGMPLLGVHPTVQTLSVQAILLAGAALALVVMLTGQDVPVRAGGKEAPIGPAPTAGAGV